MKALITGRSGVGKSTIYRELIKRNLPAIDSDRVAGLCNWRDPQTGTIVTIDSSQPVDKQKTAWTWDKEVLMNILSENGDIFLCGGADNQLEFHPLFDVVFVLTVPEKIQRDRMTSRTEHDYGRLPALQDQIINEQAELVQQAVNSGAILQDASASPLAIVDALLRKIALK